MNTHIPYNEILIHKLLDALRNEDNVDTADAKVIEGEETIHKGTVEREREGKRQREREKEKESEREKESDRVIKTKRVSERKALDP